MSGRRGSVKQAANGSWYLIVDIESDELDALGKPKRKQTRRRGFPTKAKAQAKLTEILGSIASQEYVAPEDSTLAEFLTTRWLPAIEHTIKPSTFESYRRNVRLHVAGRPIGGKRLQKVDGLDLNTLYAKLLSGDATHRPLSARSTSYISTILHRAFRDAIKQKLLVRNPVEASDPPRPSSRPEMQVWKADELSHFLQVSKADRYHAAWWLLASTGMRRGEALGLRWSDIDLDAGRVEIRRTLITTDVQRKGEPGMAWGTPKTAKGRRTVALDADTVARLRTHRAKQLEERLSIGESYQDGDLVVCLPDGRPVHPKTLSSHFDRLIKRHGLPRIRLHDLRHGWATMALRAGIHPRVVQERLGHANVSITLDTYSHVDLDMQAAAAARVAAMVSGVES